MKKLVLAGLLVGIAHAAALGQSFAPESHPEAFFQFIDRIVRPCSSGAVTLASVVINPNNTGNIVATTCTGGSFTINGTPIPATPGNVTAAGTLTLNQLIIGQGTKAVAALGSLGTTTTLLHGNAAGAPSFAAITGADCPTCVTSAAALTANRIVLGAGSQASAVLGSLGTTVTVLHGNAAGAPSFGVVTPGDAVGNVNGTGNFLLASTAPLSATTGSIAPGILIAGACGSGTVAVTSSTTSMTVSVSPNTYPGDGVLWYGYVSANGTVTVKVCAVVGLTPGASTYNVRVIQ